MDNKYIKDCASIESKYKDASKVYKKNKTLDGLQYVENVSMQGLNRAKKLLRSKVKGEAAKFLQSYKSKFEELLYDSRYDYLNILNEEYHCDIKINDYLKRHRDILEKEQLVTVVAEEGLINNVFQNIIKELIPAHPKDEYKATRTMKRHFVIHCGGTNTGKTYNAIQALKNASSGVYLAPLRLLALEIFQTLNGAGVPCTLSTGEEDIIVPGAHHISSTIEKLNVEREYGRYSVHTSFTLRKEYAPDFKSWVFDKKELKKQYQSEIEIEERKYAEECRNCNWEFMHY